MTLPPFAPRVADAAGAVAVFAGIFAIVNPLGAVPAFLSLTDGYSRAEKRQVIVRAVLTGVGVLVLFGLAGRAIFGFFDLTVPAFRIAGGVLIFTVALDMLHGQPPKTKHSEQEIQDAVERESVGITPLGIPLLSGPGSITTVMILVAGASGPGDYAVVYGSVLLTFVVAFVALLGADRVFARMGRSGLAVLSRLMGILLAAIAVQFVLRGLEEAVPGLFAASG